MPVYHHKSRIVGKIVDETFPKHRNHQDMKRYTVGVEWHVEVAVPIWWSKRILTERRRLLSILQILHHGFVPKGL